MRRGSPIIAALVVVAFWAAAFYIPIGVIYAQDEGGEKEAAPEFTYTGAKKCKICHAMAKYGAQYKIWEAGAHAKAFETLSTPEAVEAAKAAGIEGAPNEAPQCLKCHVTGYGESAEVRGAKLTMEEGVSCEACHGPGSHYYKKTVMQEITDGKIEGASVGLLSPDEKTCLGCHNDESPMFEGFDYAEYWAKIEHSKKAEAEAETEAEAEAK